MDKKLIAIALIAVIASISIYIAYDQFYTSPSSSNDSPNSSNKTADKSSSSSGNAATDSSTPHKSASTSAGSANLTKNQIIDGAGFIVDLPMSIKRIVVMDGNLAEMLCYMGLQSSIVGRTNAQCPPQLLNVKSVGEAGYAINVEAVLELQPDIIIADQVLVSDYYETGAYTKLKDAGIPIYISEPPASAQNPLLMTPEELYNAPTGIDIVCSVMQDLATVVGNKDQVDAYVTWAQYYDKLVKDRIATLSREQQTMAFFEWNSFPYYTTIDLHLYQAGGLNIAENMTTAGAQYSPEKVVEQNPSVIITLVSSPTHDVNDFIAAQNEVLNRPALKDVDAVRNERVYVCDFNALNGMRSIIGYLYWAKWLQPSLFSDIDPAKITEQLNQQYLGTPITDTFCYQR